MRVAAGAFDRPDYQRFRIDAMSHRAPDASHRTAWGKVPKNPHSGFRSQDRRNVSSCLVADRIRVADFSGAAPVCEHCIHLLLWPRCLCCPQAGPVDQFHRDWAGSRFASIDTTKEDRIRCCPARPDEPYQAWHKTCCLSDWHPEQHLQGQAGLGCSRGIASERVERQD